MICKKKRKGGWQTNVEYFKDYVIKTPKTEKEIRDTILRYLNHVGKIDELEKRVKDMKRDWKTSIALLSRKKIPLEMLGYPKFLKGGRIKQKRVLVLQDVWDELFEKGKIKEMKEIMEKTFDFIIELWRYGVHEKTFKIGYEMGLMGNKIILIDFGELCEDKKIAEKQIKKRSWEKKIIKYSRKEVSNYFNKRASKRLTLNALDKNWGIK